MYNRVKKTWESSYSEAELLWCQAPENQDRPEADFILADYSLTKGSQGHETADALCRMEKAAKAGYPQAALGMGQMFHFGWGVHRSNKDAQIWYEKALELGCEEADKFLQLLKKRRQRKVDISIALAAVVLLIILCAVWAVITS